MLAAVKPLNRVLSVALVAGILAVVVAVLVFGGKKTQYISIGTGSMTGVYYPAGGAVCRVVNAQRPQHGVSCSIDSTDGSIANIEGLRSGDLDMGIVQSDIQFEAYHGSGPFAGEGAFGDLRAVLSLHAEPFGGALDVRDNLLYHLTGLFSHLDAGM